MNSDEAIDVEQTPSLCALFFAFLKIGLMGFGGVAAIARHVIVDERRWLNDRDYAHLLGLCQALPGANTVNAAVMFGDRCQGPAGSFVCVSGLMLAPLAILVAAASLYEQFATLSTKLWLTGAALGAAGLILGTAAKLLIRARPSPFAWLCAILALVAAAIFHIRLPLILAILGPASLIGAAWTARRR